MGLFFIGFTAAALRHLWDVERVSMFLTPFAMFVKEDRYFLCVMALLSSMMCFFYILYAEGDVVPGWSTTMENVTCYIHAAEILLLVVFNCAQSQDDMVKLATTRLPADCMVCISVLVRGKVAESYFSFAFAASLRVRNLWMQFEETVSPLDKGLKVKLANEGIKLGSKIFLFAVMMQQMESFQGTPWMSQDWKPWETATSPTEVWTTTSSVYLVLCTLSTVGYGDVQPRSIIGQILLMAIIVLGIGLCIWTALSLVETAQFAVSGGGEYRIASARRMRRHIMIAGNPSAQTLEDLLAELYHDDHWATASGLDCVILLPPGSQDVVDRVQRFLRLSQNRKIVGKVWMLQGSALSNKDLQRTKMNSACLGYVLPNVYAADGEREDIENAMRALSMHRFAPYVRLVAMLLKVEYRDMMLSTGLTLKDVVCIDELKLGIMGKTCEAQGFVTLICNLFKSAGEYDETGNEENHWMPDYKRGMGNEIYEVRLAPCYRGAPFGEVAIDILKRSDAKAYMMGVIDESRYPGEEPKIHLHPGRQYRIGTNEDYILKGVFIAPDFEVIQQHPADKPFSWHLDSTGQRQADPSQALTLPNQLPEQQDKKDILVEMAQRWLLDKRVVKREQDEYTKQLMDHAAETRTAQGLKNSAHLPRSEVEEIMEMKIKEDMWNTRDYSKIEDNAEDATDPKSRALLQQELQAARTQEREKQKSAAEVRERTELRVRKMTEKMTIEAEAELDKLDEAAFTALEKEMDDELWGGPQTPRKPLWGRAQEPPPSLLIRGEHVVMIALEGNEDLIASGSSEELQVETTGRKLGLEHFMRSLRAEVPHYAQRPVVVLSQRVPYDWPRVASQHKDVYLITGRPLAEENLRQAGLRYAKAVLIYQRGPVTSNDPTLVDAQAIFGTALTESLLNKEAKDIMCIVDLHLADNCNFISKEAADEKFNADELDMKSSRAILDKEQTPYVDTKRFVSGQFFASGSALTSLVANILYNPALGSLIAEMLTCRFVVVPVPPDFTGKNYEDLYTHMMRRKNLVTIALLRRFDEVTGEDEDEEKEEPKIKVVFGDEEPDHTYDPKEPPGTRFVYCMPPGDRAVVKNDGVMCVVPKGDALAFVN